MRERESSLFCPALMLLFCSVLVLPDFVGWGGLLSCVDKQPAALNIWHEGLILKNEEKIDATPKLSVLPTL